VNCCPFIATSTIYAIELSSYSSSEGTTQLTIPLWYFPGVSLQSMSKNPYSAYNLELVLIMLSSRDTGRCIGVLIPVFADLFKLKPLGFVTNPTVKCHNKSSENSSKFSIICKSVPPCTDAHFG